MKAVFISYNKSINERVIKILDRNFARGYTRWVETQGRGSFEGEPHYGSHAWPSTNSTILTIVDETKAQKLLDDLRQLDVEASQHGVRAFVWDIVDAM